MIKKNSLKLLWKRVISFLKRRPHRSFRKTRKRDYIRPFKLSGYISFTFSVGQTIWTYRKTFIYFAVLYAVVTTLVVGMASQENYKTLVDTLNVTGANIFSGGIGEVGKASLLFVTTATGGISQNLSEVQQVYLWLIVLMAWLMNVWLLRNLLAGHKVKLRDGLYNSGAPIVSTFLVLLLFIIQLLPLAIALVGYSSASLSGLLDSGVEAMLFCIAALLFVVLSLYWITGTFIALIIVTLPGMYPYKAIKTAGDLVVGRRLQVLMRMVWMLVVTILFWAIIMIPMILFDKWIKEVLPVIDWLPTIPILLLVLSSMTIIWISSYIYLLYRKIVADDANQA